MLLNFNKVKFLQIVTIFASVVLTAGCASKINSKNTEDVKNVQGGIPSSIEQTVVEGVKTSEPHKKHFFFVTSDVPETCYYMWWWNKSENGNAQDDGHPQNWYADGAVVYGPDSRGFYGLDFNVSYEYDSFGILFVGKVNGTDKQTMDFNISTEDLKKYDEFYFMSDDKNYYVNAEDIEGLSSAVISSADGKQITCRLNGVQNFDKKKLSVTNNKQKKLKVTSAVFKDGHLTVLLDKKDALNINNKDEKLFLSYGKKTIEAVVSPEIRALYIDQNFYYEGNDLGITFGKNTVTFKSWAPLADNVELLLYKEDKTGLYKKETAYKTVGMKKGSKGVWEVSLAVEYGDYYRYSITNEGKVNLVSDIWNYAASPDSIASQIADISKDVLSMPENWETSYVNPNQKNAYTDNVIYEMHIRDWAGGVHKASTGADWSKKANMNNDCYNELSESIFFKDYLKDLGITHVQFLPSFDQAEKNNDGKYNWGYNPYHYNVPEGRYASSGYTDGRTAVREFRKLIMSLHNSGISVNMDVVYNHTSGTGTSSLYDMTVPEYFYRMNEDGSYSSGSGCGNEFATNHRMVKKYVIESLKHWMKDYHVNGFRFDLMGLQERSTIEDIYKELCKIDSSVMIYGEPWTGGSSLVVDGCTSSGSVGKAGFAVFDDDFRDAIKGGEFGGFGIGQVQGKDCSDIINLGLTGKEISNNHRNTTGNPSLAIHYVECHDNYTLFDKLVYSTLGDSVYGKGDIAVEFEKAHDKVMGDKKLLEKIKKQDKLAAAYIILSQGVPFINGGQELLRTKKGNPDSYAADIKGGIKWTNETGKYNINDVNTIDFSRKETFSDVYNTYKALIAFRRSNSAGFGKNLKAKASTIKPFVTKYETGDFVIIFNASDEECKINLKGKAVSLNEQDGTFRINEKASVINRIEAESFVIVKK